MIVDFVILGDLEHAAARFEGDLIDSEPAMREIRIGDTRNQTERRSLFDGFVGD